MRRVHGLVPDQRDHLQARSRRSSSRRAMAPREVMSAAELIARSDLRRRAAEVPALAARPRRPPAAEAPARSSAARASRATPRSSSRAGKLEVIVYRSAAQAESGLLAACSAHVAAPVFRVELTPANVIVGEMACLSGTPRTADVIALEDGEVWEVRRNVLDRLMRAAEPAPALRARLSRPRRSIWCCKAPSCFAGIGDGRIPADRRLPPAAALLRARQSRPDALPAGRPRRTISTSSASATCASASSGSGQRGESHLARARRRSSARSACSRFRRRMRVKTVEEVDHAHREPRSNAPATISRDAIPAGLRTATCSALGHLELARLSRADFLEMVAPVSRPPPPARRAIARPPAQQRRGQPAARASTSSRGSTKARACSCSTWISARAATNAPRAASQQHGTESHGVPITRLLPRRPALREFPRRHRLPLLHRPHCMVGCPVDSIHRGKHLQIVIEDHCIGCGLCADELPLRQHLHGPQRAPPRSRLPIADQPGETRWSRSPRPRPATSATPRASATRPSRAASPPARTKRPTA